MEPGLDAQVRAILPGPARRSPCGRHGRLALEVDQQDRNRGRRHARDACRLAERRRALLRRASAAPRSTGRAPRRSRASPAGGFPRCGAGARSRPAGGRCSPSTWPARRPAAAPGRQAARRARQRIDTVVASAGIGQQRRRAPQYGTSGRRSRSKARCSRGSGCAEHRLQLPRRRRARARSRLASRRARSGLHRVALALEQRPALVVDQAQLAAGRRQAQVGVVLAQQQPVLGAAGEHAVGLGAPRVIRSSTSTPR